MLIMDCPGSDSSILKRKLFPENLTCKKVRIKNADKFKIDWEIKYFFCFW